MFETIRSAMLEQIETAIQVTKIGQLIRDRLDHLLTTAEDHSEFESNLINESPLALAWRIYDHCATLTKIYSIFDLFMASLVGEICQTLPNCHPSFKELPPRTQETYRRGFAKVLAELKEKQYHKDLNEIDIVSSYLHAIEGNKGYKLLPEAFLVSKRALRLAQVYLIITDIGIQDVEQKLLGHPSLNYHTQNGAGEETKSDILRRKLNEFIDARNDAAHQEVTEIWRLDKIHAAAYLIRDLCIAVCDTAEESLTRDLYKVGRYVNLGMVTELHSSGRGIVFRTKPCTLNLDTEILIVRKEKVRQSRIYSIEVDNVSHTSVDMGDGFEIGLLLGIKCKVSDEVFLTKEAFVTTSVADGAELDNAEEPEADLTEESEAELIDGPEIYLPEQLDVKPTDLPDGHIAEETPSQITEEPEVHLTEDNEHRKQEATADTVEQREVSPEAGLVEPPNDSTERPQTAPPIRKVK
jgi:hypothetical protein